MTQVTTETRHTMQLRIRKSHLQIIEINRSETNNGIINYNFKNKIYEINIYYLLGNFSTQTASQMEIVTLSNAIEQLARKKSISRDLDQKIVLEDPTEIEKEILDSKNIQEEIDESSGQINAFLQLLY